MGTCVLSNLRQTKEKTRHLNAKQNTGNMTTVTYTASCVTIDKIIHLSLCKTDTV